MSLTKKQQLVYDYICEYIQDNDHSPTQIEIKEYFGFKSLGSVQDYIKYLTNAGFLMNNSNSVRGLTPVALGDGRDDESMIPLLGDIAAGVPLEALENPEMIEVPAYLKDKTGEFYALRVKGESMIEAGILNEDIVVIRRQPNARNGDIVVAIIENEATLKRFFRRPNHVELRPENHTMEPFILHDGSFEIKGVLVGLIRQY